MVEIHTEVHTVNTEGVSLCLSETRTVPSLIPALCLCYYPAGRTTSRPSVSHGALPVLPRPVLPLGRLHPRPRPGLRGSGDESHPAAQVLCQRRVSVQGTRLTV